MFIKINDQSTQMNSNETVDPDSMQRHLNQKPAHHTQLIKFLTSSKSDLEILYKRVDTLEIQAPVGLGKI